MNLLFLSFYLLAQLVICYWVSKRISKQEDFLLAGRSLGLPLVTLSLFATWFGAETCIGSSAEVFSHGLSGSRADPFGYSLCLILAGVLITPRIWSLKYTTLADMYLDKFGVKTEQFALWILSFSSLIWAAAQLRAFGQVVASSTSLSVELTLVLSLIFVLAYVLYGGLLGDIITDSIQAVVISVGLFTIFFYVFKADAFSWNSFWNQETQRLSFIAPGESFFERIDRWSIPILGSLVMQEVISRLLAARNVKIATRACYYAAAIYILMGLVPVFLGLAGPQLIEIAPNQKEQFIILLAQKYLPQFVYPIFLGALVSALLATIDSILIAVSALVAHNFLIPRFKVKDEKKKVLSIRLVIVAASLAVYFLARHSESIYDLLEQASSFGTAGVLVITLAGLWFKGGRDFIALGTLVGGLLFVPFYEYLDFEAPFVYSVLSCLFLYLILMGASWTFKSSPDLHSKM